jgi:hypothetical protein
MKTRGGLLRRCRRRVRVVAMDAVAAKVTPSGAVPPSMMIVK